MLVNVTLLLNVANKARRLGRPRPPHFSSFFLWSLELSTNTCRFCRVSVMIDQTPKPVILIGAKWKTLSSAWTWKDISSEVFFQTNISVSTGGRGFTRKNTRIVLFYLTLICATAYQHSVTCLEWTGFSKLKDIVVKFIFHECCSAFVGWCRMSADCLRG